MNMKCECEDDKDELAAVRRRSVEKKKRSNISPVMLLLEVPRFRGWLQLRVI